jgi:hypothetical protein
MILQQPPCDDRIPSMFAIPTKYGSLLQFLSEEAFPFIASLALSSHLAFPFILSLYYADPVMFSKVVSLKFAP